MRRSSAPLAAALIEALRRRNTPPCLRGWTLHPDGEPPYEVDPAAHDARTRAALDPDTDDPALAVDPARHRGAAARRGRRAAGCLARGRAAPAASRSAAWAAVSRAGSGPRRSGGCSTRFVGLQVPADQLAPRPRSRRPAPVLRCCASSTTPGARPSRPGRPRRTRRAAWWAAVVDYPAQLQAAWWAWHAAGRGLLPDLRICFVAGAGLAPLQHERFAARGGGRFVVDPTVFVDTSSYGRQARRRADPRARHRRARARQRPAVRRADRPAISAPPREHAVAVDQSRADCSKEDVHDRLAARRRRPGSLRSVASTGRWHRPRRLDQLPGPRPRPAASCWPGASIAAPPLIVARPRRVRRRASGTTCCLHRDAHVDVWLLCWTPRNDTGWHDHDISSGAVAVVEGCLVEHNLAVGRRSLATEVVAPARRSASARTTSTG